MEARFFAWRLNLTRLVVFRDLACYDTAWVTRWDWPGVTGGGEVGDNLS